MNDKSLQPHSIFVWDIPTRLFHWSLAASFAGAFLTSESERLRDLHVACGYTVVGLIMFRLLWGLVGSRHARFRDFVRGPATIAAYTRDLLRGRPPHHLGHNPLGGLAILAMLALGLLTGASGWLTYNEVGGEWLEEAHEVLAGTMLGVVVVHVIGVLVSSLLHRENLVRAMITGRKPARAHD